MNEFNIVKQNRICFERIDDINIKSYKITGTTHNEDGESVTETLAIIDNPVTRNLIITRKAFEYNKDLKFKLKNNTVYSDYNYKVKVYIDGQKLNIIFVSYDKDTNQVTIDYKNISNEQTIEIEYYYDGIEFFHEASKAYIYNIELMLDYTKNSIGEHNILV